MSELRYLHISNSNAYLTSLVEKSTDFLDWIRIWRRNLYKGAQNQLDFINARIGPAVG